MFNALISNNKVCWSHISDEYYPKTKKKSSNSAINFQCGMRFPDVNYLPEEHSCWNAIYTRLEKIWPSTACKEFLEGYQVLTKSGLLKKDRIPDVSKISKLLESKTGFRLRPATGLCPAREFLACLGMVLLKNLVVTEGTHSISMCQCRWRGNDQNIHSDYNLKIDNFNLNFEIHVIKTISGSEIVKILYVFFVFIGN